MSVNSEIWEQLLSVFNRLANLYGNGRPLTTPHLEFAAATNVTRNPATFDPDFYRSKYADLAKLSPVQLWNHFVNHGIAEGRWGSNYGGRNGLGERLNLGQPILEIAPWTSPFFKGPNVKYADILNNDELLERAIKVGRESLEIPRMDYLISPTNLSDSIDEKFEIVASSHVLEHQPNLLEHLRQVGQLLEPRGRYALAIPDRRYCFDHFKPETTLEDVLLADHEKRVRHTLESLTASELLRAHNDAGRHWAGDHGSPLNPEGAKERAQELYQASLNGYEDCHTWFFTPLSFKEIMDQSYSLGLQPFKVENLYFTMRDTFEFHAVLAVG